MAVNKRIYLSSPHMCGLEEQFVHEAFDTNWIAPLGPNVDAFEVEISERVGIKAVAALSSGTAAIHMALKYLGVSEGDTVFCSSLTFAASCNPVIYEKAVPVFIDSEPDSWNMSPVALEKAFCCCEKENRLPKVIIIVNLYGQSADYDPIREICEHYKVTIIEDAAESLGATYKDRNCGTLGYFGVYSFNGNKIITTSGGGALVSDDEAAIRKVRFWSTQSRDAARHYQHSELGYNYRMSNVLAGIGRGQLRVLDSRIMQKKHIFETYKRKLADIPDIQFTPVADFGHPNYWLSCLTIKEGSRVTPLDIILALEKSNIESRPVWKPLHLQPIFKESRFFSHNTSEKNVAEDIYNRGVCLPSDTKMTDEDLNNVSEIIRQLFI